MTERLVRIYPLFERFWHWSQAALIFLLLFTGFAIRGLHHLVGFQAATTIHTFGALALVVLWIFAIFWHLTTGSWVHYLPTTKGLGKVARFYAYGIFKGEPHPYRKAYRHKHNPLQAMSYLALKLILFPAIWISGIVYLTFGLWASWPEATVVLEAVAGVHVLTAFAILAFIIVHVYLLTTGHSFREAVMPMITGYDVIDLTKAEEDYLAADEPHRLG